MRRRLLTRRGLLPLLHVLLLCLVPLLQLLRLLLMPLLQLLTSGLRVSLLRQSLVVLLLPLLQLLPFLVLLRVHLLLLLLVFLVKLRIPGVRRTRTLRRRKIPDMHVIVRTIRRPRIIVCRAIRPFTPRLCRAAMIGRRMIRRRMIRRPRCPRRYRRSSIIQRPGPCRSGNRRPSLIH